MPSLFDSDSMIWRINRERLLLLGGPAAAVLQVAHPQVAMGVAAHSSFRTDPLRRLRGTLDAVYAVAFGTNDEVEAVRSGVARAHRAVRGDGYSAFDPGAQLWVLATLIMGSVTMYQRFVKTLTVPELDQFLEEHKRFGKVFGLDPELIPKSWDEFLAYWQEMINGPLLGSHPLCAEVANAVIRADTPWHLRQLSPVIRALTVENLPSHICKRLQIDSGILRGVLWGGLDRLPLIRIMPENFRFAPQYLRARNRD